MGWSAVQVVGSPFPSVGRARLTDNVILEQRLEGSGERGMACVREKHVLDGEDRRHKYPQEEACLPCLRPVNQEARQEPVHLGTLSQGRAEQEVGEVTEVWLCRVL